MKLHPTSAIEAWLGRGALRPMPRCICPNPRESARCPGIPACWCPLHFATWREYVATDRARYVPHPD